MTDAKKGFKRIAWVLSALCFLVILVGAVYAVICVSEIMDVRDDPEFRALSTKDQNAVIQWLRQRYPGWPLVILGGSVFVLSWGSLFLFRWMLKLMERK